MVKKLSNEFRRNWWIHIIMTIAALVSILPFILMFMVSITDEKTALTNGYSFFPAKFSSVAYEFLFYDAENILRAYGITISVTVIGTCTSLFIGTMLAYTLSRKDYPLRKFLSFYVVFTLLFNGGLVPWYLVFSKIFLMKDTIYALIVPGLLLNSFNVLVMRTFFANSVQESLIESAYLDGAGEFRIYAQIIMPLSLPVVAAIGFMVTLSYWNDWYNSMVFMSKDKLVSLQYLMTKVLLNIQFLQATAAQSADAGEIMKDMPAETVRMAMAIVGIGPMMFAFPFFQKYFIKGLTIGAVKG